MKSIGDDYESRAAVWLTENGLRIVKRNYRVAVGEIDIIAWDGPQLVFVEVRARNHSGFASAAESVNANKRRRIIKTAQRFLQEHKTLAHAPCRFDVIAFEPPQSGAGLRWIRSAFGT